ncbi:hypothetical protein L1987_16884 [Smallanthus sonchifolius]|uniref:Uncharacterized protein n=1 Tax=Smallanthus sonchifolius TaxID=185202 RepID=A0ACB9IWH3_9ASTR|nr:hypothetical protein L1987_16884 [Smallanthus sonchifolius]
MKNHVALTAYSAMERTDGDLLKILLTGRCRDWLKAYIMTAIVDFKPRAAPADNIQDIGDWIHAIITAAKHDD